MKAEIERILQLVKEKRLTVEEGSRMVENITKANKKSRTKQAPLNDGHSEKSTKFIEDDQTDQTYHNYEAKSTTDKIFDFVDSAFKKVKDLNFTKNETISHVFQDDNVEISEIYFDLANGSLDIIPWEQPGVRIECESKIYQVSNLQDAQQQFNDNVVFSVEKGQLTFILQQKLIKTAVVCYVPKHEYNIVQARLFNGTLTAKNVVTKDFQANTANGQLSLQAITSTSGSFETANGNITLENSLIDKIAAETLNGKIIFSGHCNKINSKTFNGNIKLNLQGDQCQYVDARAITGAIEIKISEKLSLARRFYGELKTNFGNFKVSLGEMEIIEEQQDLAQKLLSFRTVTPTEADQLHIFANTRTGLITLEKQGLPRWE